MLTSLVLTVIGRDRPGLVSALSDKAATFGANWIDARMAQLAGQFAGIVHLQVPTAQADALAAALRELEAVGLRIDVARSEGHETPPARLATLELLGQDKPGIVRDISSALAARSISIDEFESGVISGAMSGETMFRARARLRIPEGMALEELRATLESLANELMVDVELGDAGPPR